MNAIQWKCGECGQWVDSPWAMHVHHRVIEPTIESMIYARRMNEALPGSANPLAETIVGETRYFRTGKEPTREKPI